jgi:hypothetical protein
VHQIYNARTPLVLGTSSPPVRVMAIRIARARALNAASALYVSDLVPLSLERDVHVMVVVSPDVIDV